MADRRSYAIGVDIGGTKIAVGLVDSEGNLIDSTILPTESEKGVSDAAARIHQAACEMITAQNLSKKSIMGMGVGCPGPLDLKSGMVMNPYTLPGWENVSLTQALEDAFGNPVRIENDADVALIGECWVGAGKGKNPVVMLTFGTGVGGAVRCDGRVYRGVNGEHPEIGLMPVLPDMPPDYSGVDGSLESLASGAGIAQQGKAFGFEDAAAVFDAAQGGHREAEMIVQRAYRAAGVAAWTLAHCFVPQRIILGGGLMNHHFHHFSHTMRDYLSRAKLLPENSIDIAKAQLANRAGMIGAAGLWLMD
jgi:glucokinase